MVIALARKVTLGTNVTSVALEAVMDVDNLMEDVIHVTLVTMAAHVSTVAVIIVKVTCVISTQENVMLVSEAFMEISAMPHALQTVNMILVFKALELAVMDVT